jgi:DNA-binding transcriptional ArsR family regulator
MTSISALAETATLIGEPARTAMLVALMDGRALTAGELARAAGITPQTASGHLARLGEAGLLAGVRQGRHHYFRLASPAVARMIEGLMAVTAELAPARPIATGPRDPALRRARICYDHLAGELAVAIADSLRRAGHVELDDERAALTARGADFLAGLGLGLPCGNSARPGCRPCLDWSERRPHLAGPVGSALLDHLLERGWIARTRGSRAVRLSPEGALALERTFGLNPIRL